jgi:ATP-dependent DNA helicase RecQ
LSPPEDFSFSIFEVVPKNCKIKMEFSEEVIERVLRHLKIDKELRVYQKETILSTINFSTTIASIPTGGGKTLIYTLIPYYLSIALKQSVVAIIISPLLALIEEQVDNLAKDGINSFHIARETSEQTLIDAIKDNKLFFICPESFDDTIHTFSN